MRPFTYGLAKTLLMDSPAHTQVVEVDEPTAEMDFGLILHTGVTGKGADVVSLAFPDWRTKVARDSRDAVRAAGKTPVLEHKWAAAQEMLAAVLKQFQDVDPPIPFQNGIPERSIFWKEDGVECRATPDWLHADYRTIDDLKTVSTSAHPAIFSRTLWDKGYDLQAALYRRAVKRVYGIADPDFRFIVAETKPPYAISVVSLDPQALEFANTKLDRALAIWKRCLETNEWPAYPTRTAYAEVPAYLLAQWQERSYWDGVQLPTG